jgi:hypothetical protein
MTPGTLFDEVAVIKLGITPGTLEADVALIILSILSDEPLDLSLFEAYKFLELFETVHEVEYDGCTLYNVLLHEYSIMKVNGMVCETLHPSHKIARLYKSLFINNGLNINRKNAMNSSLRLISKSHVITA